MDNTKKQFTYAMSPIKSQLVIIHEFVRKKRNVNTHEKYSIHLEMLTVSD